MAYTLPPLARAELLANLVPESAIAVVEHAVPIIESVCERAGRDYDEDEGDDANLFGQQCSRRTRNLVGKDVSEGAIDTVRAVYPRGSLVLIADQTRIHIWAAGDDEGSPRLKGGKTKPAILDACVRQLKLWEERPTEAPEHLVLAYRATPASRRVDKIVVGLPSGPEHWHFAAEVYDRAVHSTDKAEVPPVRRFDAEPPPAPVIELRPRRDEREER
jgi:hypothetical protein